MWETIKAILARWGITFDTSRKEFDKDKEDVRKYEDTAKANFTAIFANVLSTLSFADSSVSIVSGDTPTKRGELLNEILQIEWSNIKRNIAIGNGGGMIVSIPYVTDGELGKKIYIDTVPKDRFFVTGTQGHDIIAISVIADIICRDSKKYIRWTNYQLLNGNYVITQKATLNDKEIPLEQVKEWANIIPEITISGVDRLPVGIYKCPASNRRPKNIIGVPITYGCDETLKKIAQTLSDIEAEFKNKKVKIYADKTLFDKDMKLTDLYIKTKEIGKMVEGGNRLIDVFDPAFRETAYYTKLSQLFAQLEKEVGTSRGILTDLETGAATATEIKRATYQTFALCDDIHKNTEKYVDGLMYGVNVLANAYNLTPPSEYDIQYDWSYSMLEDSMATWQQYKDAQSVGAMSKSEIRAWLTGETMEEAQAKIDEITQEQQSNIQQSIENMLNT